MNPLKTGALLLSLGLAAPAEALDYRLSFAGVVSGMSGPVGTVAGSSIDIGTAVSGSLVYNADSPPDEIQSGLHYYYNAISAFDIAIGEFEAQTPPASFTFIQVNAGGTFDEVHINLGLTEPFASFSTLLNLQLGSLNGSLPKSLPPFSSALSSGGTFIFEDDPSNPATVGIEWTSLTVAAVPEPETWAFLLSGFAVLVWRLTART
ncbi:MAG TPA: hypothetical protein VJM53_02770 [Burkholderiales bacterium]|nr:hypothetical protein [Burkholderiales bacterium]